jgi:hypothetical protein
MRHRIGSSERRELHDVIRTVRRRWRIRHALRGGLLTTLSAVTAVLAVSFMMSWWPGSAAGATAVAVVLYLGVAVVAVRTLFRPLFRRVTDPQVAQYLEENEPGLSAEILTAVSAMDDDSIEENMLLDGLVRSAVRRAREVEGGMRIDRQPLQRLSWSSAGVAAALLLFFFADPFGFRQTFPDIARPWTAVEAASPLAIQVLPGDTAVARGAELRVAARTLGFTTNEADLVFRSEDQMQWDRWPMIDGETVDDHEFIIFRVDQPLEYYVESEGIRSGTHRVDVIDVPYVSRLELEVHHPAYTNRAPETMEFGGDLVVLPGTTVRVRAHPTLEVPTGRIVLEGVGEIELQPGATGAMEGQFTVQQPGFYRIELDDDSGRTHRGTPDHLIDLVRDLPPIISLSRPGRDVRVTAIEEVFVEARANDDFGISNLDIIYSVNGGEDRVISLLSGGDSGLADVTAGHTFFLEDYELEPGDLVAYHARARDTGPNALEREARTDLFFIEIRPFSQEFRQAEQDGGGGGGGGGGDDGMAGQFSQRQRDIVTATFNVDRDWRAIDPTRLEEDIATVAQAQARLRDEVEGFLSELRPRLARMAEEMRQVAETLPHATEAMEEAIVELREGRPAEALAPEQRALQYLLRAEAVFREVQLAQQQDQGGGGGGGNQELREDLADFFDLEMDRLRNQYEELQRGERQEMDRQMDEALERLRELARRQQQEEERLRRAADQLPQGASAGGESQRRLAEETEEMARQLERLAREQNSPDLAETARRLQEAAEAMRQSAAARDQRGLNQASAATEAIEEARRLLDRNLQNRLDSDAADAVNRAQRAMDRQRGIQQAVENMPVDAAGRRDALPSILEEKDELVRELERLDEDLRRLSREAAGTDPEAERAFREAAAAIRDGQLTDRVDFSRGLVSSSRPQQTQEFEAQITSLMEEMNEQVQRAAGSLDGRERDLASDMAERTRELVRSAESMAERARQASQQGAQGDQSGEPGSDDEQADGQAGGQAGGAAADGETMRQLQREASERRQQAEALRDQLAAGGGGDMGWIGGLDEAIERFRELETARPYADAASLADLQQALVEGLRELDFALRRHFAGADREGPMVAGSGDVPEEYRQMVEEYYRSLAGESP